MTDKLSDRVMALEGPDREVDAEIAIAVGWFVSEPNKGWPERMDYIDIRSGTKSYPGGGFDQLVPKFSASLDAAMSLVPEGWLATHLSELGGAGGCVCKLGNPGTSEDAISDDGARTMALALCAATLKSRGL